MLTLIEQKETREMLESMLTLIEQHQTRERLESMLTLIEQHETRANILGKTPFPSNLLRGKQQQHFQTLFHALLIIQMFCLTFGVFVSRTKLYTKIGFNVVV